MSEVWPSVPLGDVIRHRKEFIEIENEQTYKRCRVQLHAKGIVLRDAVKGSEIKTKKQQVVKADEFLVAEIDAKVGGFGIVPADLEEAIVSSHYFLYQINEALIDRRFFGYYIHTHTFRDQVGARGSTNYAAIRPHHVLEYTTPLPPLSEQRRIVGRLERLASKIEEARGLRDEIKQDTQRTIFSAHAEISEGAEYKPMAEVAPLVRRKVDVVPEGRYPELGVRSFGKGAFVKPALSGDEVGNKKLYRIEEGDLIFQIVFAWEGAVAVAEPEDAGRVGSHRFLTCVPKEGVATSNYLRYYFLSSEGLEKLGKASPGGAGRNRTLAMKALAEIEVPTPPIKQQQRFDSICKNFESVKRYQKDARAELDALLPSVLDKAFRGGL